MTLFPYFNFISKFPQIQYFHLFQNISIYFHLFPNRSKPYQKCPGRISSSKNRNAHQRIDRDFVDILGKADPRTGTTRVSKLFDVCEDFLGMKIQLLDQVGNNAVVGLVRDDKIEVFEVEVAAFERPFEGNPHKVAGMHKHVPAIGHLEATFAGTKKNRFGPFADMSQTTRKNIEDLAGFWPQRLFGIEHSRCAIAPEVTALFTGLVAVKRIVLGGNH